jgi:hypothetical protein
VITQPTPSLARSLTRHAFVLRRYSNRKLSQELENTQSTARTIAERNRTALQRLQDGLAGVEAAVEQRSEAGYQQVQHTFSWAKKLQKLLLPGASAQHSTAGAPAAPREAGHIIGEIFRSLSALGTLLTSAAGERPLGMPGFSSPGAAAAAAAPEAEVEQLCDKVGQLSQRLQDATSDKLALQGHIAGAAHTATSACMTRPNLHVSCSITQLRRPPEPAPALDAGTGCWNWLLNACTSCGSLTLAPC